MKKQEGTQSVAAAVCTACCCLLQGANAIEAVWLVVVLTVLLVTARAAFVIPFSLLHNCWSAPADRLTRRDVVIVWWAGLMRGEEEGAVVWTQRQPERLCCVLWLCVRGLTD
jgi:lysylphosphatidylglycerol synthetase-like protein (DUF2156 family)